MNVQRKCPNIEEFAVLLRKNSMKATSQRLAVHRAMLQLGHASADMVAEEIARDGQASITITSIYNTLSELSGIGVYRRRMSSNNKCYFDVNTMKHIHLYDRVNNTYKDIIDDELMAMIAERFARRRFKGYKIEDIDIQIICHPTKSKAM